MPQLIKEAKRLQKLAGIITESAELQLEEGMKFNSWIELTDAEKKTVEQTYNQNKPLADKLIAAAKTANEEQAAQLYRNMTNMWQRYIKAPFTKNDYSVSDEVNNLMNDLNTSRNELRKKYPGIEKSSTTPTSSVPPKPPKPGAPPKPQTPGAPPKPQSPGAPPKPQSPGAPPKPQTPGAPPKPQTPGAPPKKSLGSKIKSFFKGKK
jgi:hypothetical protein